ncbi:MAG: dipeptide epimerase [Deinococcus sp.]|nr:dipeptide epimerase [Deinococcus sp.]
MKLDYQVIEVHPKHPFTISRGTSTVYRRVIVQLTHEGVSALGEAAPSPYYGETADTVVAALELFRPLLGADPFNRQAIMGRLGQALGGNNAAKAAINLALWDLAGKLLGEPLYRLLGLDAAATPRTSLTIALDQPAAMAERAQAAYALGFSLIKVKLGTGHDRDIVTAIREAVPQATLRVDANAAWTPSQALHYLGWLAELGVELVEQPLPAADIEGLRRVTSASPLPIVADESAPNLASLRQLKGAVSGVNIKLMKCGGIDAALEMIHAARALGMLVMLGCMVETSVAIAAGAHLSPLVDYADLDGSLLLADDPFQGPTFPKGRITLVDDPGLGVQPSSVRSQAA